MNYTYNLGLLFHKIVKNFPENVAIKFSLKEHYSYQELNIRSNKFARYLSELGLKPNDVVCISGIKNINIYALILACLKIGVVYTILDPESPLERLIKIMNRCAPKVAFLDSSLFNPMKNLPTGTDFNLINIESEDIINKIQQYESSDLEILNNINGDNPAYIMFTSGSTGFPKGAVMTHINVINFIYWAQETFNISSDDIHTNVNPLYFDNSVFDFYSTIFSGACLVPFDKEIVTDPALLVKKVDELNCTSWFSVPSMLIYLQTMKVLKHNNFSKVKKIIFGGEGYPKAKLYELYKLYSSRVIFYNVYGPTECTCMCSSYTITQDDFTDLYGFPPLGRMASNFSFLILDEFGNKVNDGESGELCLIGPNVGKGYYNDPDRTNMSFVQNPYNKMYTEIIYKTGDLVRYETADEKIYILGRADNQIKHMGYRIELEEIENAINTLPFVKQSVVFQARNGNISNIIAVIASEDDITSNQIRKDLGEIIPGYMIPSKFYFEPELPKNQNGKIDRKNIKEVYSLKK